jgi:hypothetical protein
MRALLLTGIILAMLGCKGSTELTAPKTECVLPPPPPPAYQVAQPDSTRIRIIVVGSGGDSASTLTPSQYHSRWYKNPASALNTASCEAE